MDFPTIDEAQLMTGVDIPIEGLGITIRQPTIKEISMLGETNYFIALQIFLMDKQSLKIQSEEVNNWTIFQKALTQKIEGISSTKDLVMNFLQLFFKDPINLGPRSLILMMPQEVKSIEPEEFNVLQFVIGEIGGRSLISTKGEEYNVKSARAKEIAEKMKRAHEKLAKVKAAQGGKKKPKGFIAKYIKTVAIGTSNSLSDVLGMTLLQLNSIMKMYLAWEAYDLDVRSRLAGAKNDKQLVHWTSAEEEDSSVGTI